MDNAWRNYSDKEYADAAAMLVHFSYKYTNSNNPSGGIRLPEGARRLDLPYVCVSALGADAIGLEYVSNSRQIGSKVSQMIAVEQDNFESFAERPPVSEIRRVKRAMKCLARPHELNVDKVGQRLRQVLLPMPDGRSVSMTPLACGGLNARLAQKLAAELESSSSHDFMPRPRAFLCYGGSNPQNVGRYAIHMRKPLWVSPLIEGSEEVAVSPSPAGYTDLWLPALLIESANAQPAWWLVGPPPMTAALGFSRALAAACGLGEPSSVAILMHGVQFNGDATSNAEGVTLYPEQHRSASFIDKADHIANRFALSHQPTARCTTYLSIRIRLEGAPDIDLPRLTGWLAGAHYAGGRIRLSSSPFVVGSTVSTNSHCLPAGSGPVDQSRLLFGARGGDDVLDRLLSLTRPTQQQPMPALIPSTLGFVAISPFAHKENVREGVEHAFAEPLVGLLEFKSVTRTADLHCWHYAHPYASCVVVTSDLEPPCVQI